MLKRLLKTMARPIALGAFGLTLVTNSVYAQLSSVYTSATSSGTYTAITGGLSLGTSTSDDQMYVDSAASSLGGILSSLSANGPGIPIGFNFNFKGVIYDRLGVCTNGWIALGQSSRTPAVDLTCSYGSNYFFQPISSPFYNQASELQNRIVALGIDLLSQSGASIRVETVGTAPYRSCIVQWDNYKNYYGSSGEEYDFQIKLNETFNTVEVNYGTFTVNYSDYPQVGLLLGSDFMNRSTLNTTTYVYGDWTTNSADGIYNWQDNELSGSYYPASGLTYTWAPPLATYSSSTVATASTVGVTPSSTNQVIVRLEVNTTGFRGLLNLANIDVSTNGTTVASDIDSLRVFYTGLSPVFSTANQYGTTVASPGVSNVVSSSYALKEGTNYFWVAYDISSGATLGDYVDAQIASVTIGTTTYVPTVTAPSGNRQVAAPMTYVGSEAFSVDPTKVAAGSVNNAALGIRVITSSTGSGIDLTSLDISTNGSTDTLDLQNLKVWYTGNSNVFDLTYATQFGSTVAVPGPTQTITGSQSLNNDSNYFWVTYDIASGATVGDTIDGEFTGVTVDATPQTPGTTTTTGFRTIRQPYCIPSIMYASNSCGYNYYISGVTTTGGTTNISNNSNGCGLNSSASYSNFTNQSGKILTIQKNTTFSITVSGPSFQNAAIFIDYNGDGDFADAGEKVAASTTYSSGTTILTANNILIPCAAQVGKTVLRVRGSYYNYIPVDGCSNSASGGGSVYYGESEDYTIDILDNPTVYTSSSTIQQTGNVATGGTDRPVLRVPVLASGCQVGTVTEFRFNTNGSTNTADITNAKLYATGNNPNFTTSKLLGTVASPSGSFMFTVTDTLLGNPGDTNNYWLAYDISASAGITNVVDGEVDSLYATGSYHIPSVTAPAGNITIEAPMTFVSTTVVASADNSVAQGTNNAEIVKILVVTSSTGAPISVSSLDVSTAGTTSLSDITNLRVWYTGNNKVFSASTQFGSTVASPSTSHTVTGNQALMNDSNYFWVTYDVVAGATIGDSLDGTCSSITVDGVAQTPTATSTTGFRRVRQPYCIPAIYYASMSCGYSYYISSVVMSGGSTNISNTGNGCGLDAVNSYSDFTSIVGAAKKNSPFTVTVNGVTSFQNAAIFIDYNQDGDFTDPGEKVAYSSTYSSGSTMLTANIVIPCSALTGKTVMRIRSSYYNYSPTDGCTNSASGGAMVYYGESEDYTLDILDNPTTYTSSSTLQQTGTVSPSATNRKVLRVPVIASGCQVGTVTEFRFNTNGSTNTGDITSAKLYATGNGTNFNTNKLLGTVSSPSGQFTFTVNDTLLGNMGDTNNYWLTYNISSGAGVGNTVDAELDSLLATGAYHIPTVSAPSGSITIELPMTFVSTTVRPAQTSTVAQGAANTEVVKVLVVTSSTGAPIDVTSMDVATTGTTSLSDITNLKVWYSGNTAILNPTTAAQFGTTVASPAASQTVTGLQALTNDSNYFWVTYDVISGATINDTLDGECTSITVDAVAHTPTTTNAAGYRRIRQPYCIPSIMYASNSCGYSYYITGVVTTGGVTNISNTANGCGIDATNSYSDFTGNYSQVLSVKMNTTFNITVSGPTFQNAAVFIDYNQDGDFADAGEYVAASTNYSSTSTMLAATITVPCGALTGKTVMRVRGSYYNYVSTNGCTTSATNGGSVYYGESEDYTIEILDNPTSYTSSNVVQQTGSVSPSATNRKVLRVPLTALGCGVGTVTEFRFNTNGSTNAGDIASAKLYKTGNGSIFNTNTLLGTVSSPSGQFTFTVTDTLLGNPGDTNNYWLAYDMTSGAGVGNAVDAQLDSVLATGAYHIPTVSAPSGSITVELPMTFVSTTAVVAPTSTVAQGATNREAVKILVVTSSTGAPIDVTSMDIATTGTTSLSDITNLNVWYTGNAATFNASTAAPFGTTVASPAASQTVTGLQALGNDSNYFWVTYDVASGATLNDSIDGECTSITVDAVAHTPTTTNAAGYRRIRQPYCIPSIMYASNSCGYNYYIDGVTTSGGVTNISNTANGCGLNASASYSDFTNTTHLVSVKANSSFNITVSGPTFQNAAVFIDFNGDGDFADAGEYVAASTGYSSSSTMLAATISIPCNVQIGKTVMRVRGSYYNYISTDGCSNAASGGGAVYYGESEDYNIEILDNPATYTSSNTVQQTGSVSVGTADRAILQVPIVAGGCGVGTTTEFRFTTSGTSSSDIASAKLYVTGNTPYFNTSKLLGTVASPSGQFSFTVADTLLTSAGTTNYYWLAYDISATAGLGNSVDAIFDSVQATGGYHVPTTSNPSGSITILTPMTYVSSSAMPVATNRVAQGSTNSVVAEVQVITSSTGAPIYLSSMDVATTGTNNLSNISNLNVWYTGNSSTFAAGVQFGSTVASPSSTQTVTGNMPLANDTNYFWITYDISGSATIGDTVDGEISSITVAATAQTPSVTNAAGYRLIRQEYCTPNYLYPGYVCSNSYYISGVSTSGASTNFSNTGNGCPLQLSSSTSGSMPGAISYSNFTSYSASVVKSASFNLTITDPYGYNSYTVWIDYNQDGVFSSTEIAASYNYNYSSSVTLSITTSPTALTGATVMRVRSSAFNSPPSDPCSASSTYYGEGEDYTIDILPLPAPTTYVWNQTAAADFSTSSNWTPSRSLVLGNDVLEFSGGGTVTVNNVPTQFVSTITVDNATTVQLNASSTAALTAGDQLNLTSGGIVASSNLTLVVGADATNTGTITGIGTIDGKLRRWVSASTGAYDFPLVSGTDGRNTTITFTSAPSAGGTLTAQFVPGSPSTIGLPVTVGSINANTLAQEGIWRVTSANGLTGGTYTGTIYAQNIGGVTSYADLVLLKRTGGFAAWFSDGTSITTSGSNSSPLLSNSGMSGFGEYGVAGDAAVNPLPVELINFTGIADSRNAYLNWSTANETNNKGFFVERSVNQKTFTAVDFVKGAGTVTSIQKYALTDANAFEKAQSNVLYYRLKQVDMNGNFTYSNVIAVHNTKPAAVAVKASPNPFNSTVDLTVFANEAGTADITVVDLQGKVIATKAVSCDKGASNITINELSNSYNGVYFVRFTLNGETSVIRLVKID